MLEHRQHNHVIEESRRKGQRRTQICASALPSAAPFFAQLIIHAGAKSDAICRIVKKSSIEPAAKIAHARIIPDVRIRCSKTQRGDQSVDSGVGHYLKR